MRGHAVVVADDQGVIRLWSDEAQAIFGDRREDALGRSLDLLVPEQFQSTPAHAVYAKDFPRR